MLEKIKSIEEKYLELASALENVGDDYHRAVEISKEKSELEDVFEKARQYREIAKQIEEANQIIDIDDAELRELAVLDLRTLEPHAINVM